MVQIPGYSVRMALIWLPSLCAGTGSFPEVIYFWDEHFKDTAVKRSFRTSWYSNPISGRVSMLADRIYRRQDINISAFLQNVVSPHHKQASL